MNSGTAETSFAQRATAVARVWQRWFTVAWDVRAELAAAFKHYNERHPHSALKYRSPPGFRRAVFAQPMAVGV
ncbi:MULTISPECIES: transposase [Mycetohabitans]|uniref:transposase n=1 Tax=Mycetohabitans TaxID=2571159 RepID=UPI00210214E0|nr:MULTISPECIES: transposase [Mycetohabitans]